MHEGTGSVPKELPQWTKNKLYNIGQGQVGRINHGVMKRRRWNTNASIYRQAGSAATGFGDVVDINGGTNKIDNNWPWHEFSL